MDFMNILGSRRRFLLVSLFRLSLNRSLGPEFIDNLAVGLDDNPRTGGGDFVQVIDDHGTILRMPAFYSGWHGQSVDIYSSYKPISFKNIVTL